ncbi:MAG: hypothetical protein R2794_06335 [Chitinophagales bacterium]
MEQALSGSADKHNGRRSFSAIALCICFAVIIAFVLYYPKWQKQGPEATISYDVAGYYMYLPATIIYHDLKGLSFQDEVLRKYNYTSGPYQAVALPSGGYTMKYPIGAAVMYLPFFLIGHGIATVSSYPADGYSTPYQCLLSLGCLCYAFLGLWLLRKLLLKWFSDTVTGLTLVILVCATNYLNYSAIDNAMTHNLLFTVYVALIWFTVRFWEKKELKVAFRIGMLCGLATIIRPTEIISVLIPVLWGLKNLRDIPERLRFFLRGYRYVLLFALGAFLFGAIQLMYWKYSTGSWFFYSYEEQTFSWLHPHLKDGLISYQKGWFIYTPVMLLIVPGSIFLYRYKRDAFWAISVFICINIYIAFSWDIWWYGGSLGQRSMVQSYALLTLPIASLLTFLLQQKWLRVAPVYIFCAACVWYNIVLTLQAHGKDSYFESEHMTRNYFWSTFGKLHVDRSLTRFIDSNDKYRATSAIKRNFLDRF